MEYEKQYHSYLVRLWQDELKNGSSEVPRWQGEVVHIQTGRSWPVDDLKTLSDLLKELTTKNEP